MANPAGVANILKNFKNAPPPNSVTARVMLEQRVDKDTVFRRETISETVVMAGGASGSPTNLTTQLPAGAKVINASYVLVTAMTLGTAVKLGIGTAAKPFGFMLSGTTMTIGTTQTLASTPATPADAAVAAATTMQIVGTDTNGSPTGTAAGTVKVCVVYEYQTALAA